MHYQFLYSKGRPGPWNITTNSHLCIHLPALRLIGTLSASLLHQIQSNPWNQFTSELLPSLLDGTSLWSPGSPLIMIGNLMMPASVVSLAAPTIQPPLMIPLISIPSWQLQTFTALMDSSLSGTPSPLPTETVTSSFS